MTDHEGVYQWEQEVAAHFPVLSGPQARVLAWWSVGMVLAQSCAVTAVAVLLGAIQERKLGSVRQQLREFCYPAERKRGAKRQTLNVSACVVPLLRWVIKGYGGRQLALAVDATTLGDRFSVLAVSVVVRGCAIPVHWTILPAQERHPWGPEWVRMLRQLAPALPTDWTVVVLADRGLYARWLFAQIVALGWHPLLRINLGASFRPAGQHAFRPLRDFVPQPGTTWRGAGIAFATPKCRLRCTLLACWEAGYTTPWLILTDLPPEAADACWYGLRAWIEQGFKLLKRGGWQWQRTRITDPARAERLWLAVAVATLWLVRVGGEADAAIPDGTLLDLMPAFAAQRRQRRATRLRLVSLFRLGHARILAALLAHRPLPTGAFLPEPWPAVPPLPTDPFLPAAAAA